MRMRIEYLQALKLTEKHNKMLPYHNVFSLGCLSKIFCDVIKKIMAFEMQIRTEPSELK